MQAPSLRLSKHPGKGAAFAIHLVSSLLAFSALVAMMMLFWFPGELFFLDGGLEGLKLVAMVDLVLGPALTLVLYKPDKPRLVFDLSVIAAIQLGALAYGFHTMHAQRTVAIVYAENRFMTLSANDHENANHELVSLGVSPKKLNDSELLSVPLVLTPDPENYGQFMADILNGYPEPRERSDLYIPIAQGRPDMLPGRLTQDQLQGIGTLDIVHQALSHQSRNIDQVEIYRFKSRYSSGLALFDPETLRILDYVPLHGRAPATPSIATADE
ncbi:MAG: hypothetical protein AB8B63_14485 [Granulosicoccus sp.]